MNTQIVLDHDHGAGIRWTLLVFMKMNPLSPQAFSGRLPKTGLLYEQLFAELEADGFCSLVNSSWEITPEGIAALNCPADYPKEILRSNGIAVLVD